MIPWPGTCHGRWMEGAHVPGLVSVILPTFEREALLGHAIESVFLQTHRPLELVVVDDGSSDGTPDVVAAWAERAADDPELTLESLRQENRGAPAARNLGLLHSRGEFVQYLDSDDVLAPEKIAPSLAALAEHPETEYVWSRWRILDEPEAATRWEAMKREPPRPAPRFRVVRGAALRRIPTKAVVGLFRRSLCMKLGPWNEALRRHQDWEYTTRLLGGIGTACFLDREHYLIRRHVSGRISDLKNSRQEAFLAKLGSLRAAIEFSERRGAAGSAPSAHRRRILSRRLSVVKEAIRSGKIRTGIRLLRDPLFPGFPQPSSREANRA